MLLAKLNHYGIRGVSNDWFKCYLSNENQYLSINGYESGLRVINCGVSQGSVRSSRDPSIFTIYAFNQARNFCKVHHFADDPNLLRMSNSTKKLSKLVNVELNNLFNWLNANKISLNVKKNWNGNL